MDLPPVSRTTRTVLAICLSVALGAWGINQLFRSSISYLELTHWQNPRSTNDTVAVSGEGKVTAIPDVAVVSLSVESNGKTVAEVQRDSTAKMNEIIGFLKGLDIEKKDIQTTQYSLYPNYSYNPQTGRQTLEGYRLTQTVEVKVRDLTHVGEAVGGATDRGANQVGSLSFTIDDPEALQQQARLKAIAKARAKAEALAEAAGVRLGKVRSFSENVSTPPPYPLPYYARDMALGAEAKGVAPQVEAGSQEVTVSVSLSYEIE